MENWKSKTIEFAERNGLCNNYMTPLKGVKNIDQMIRLYKNCPEWAIENRFPPLEWIRENLDKDLLASNGIYIDTHFEGELINNHICCIFHNCTGIISTGFNLKKVIVPTLYIASKSNLEITASSEMEVSCYVFDDSSVVGNVKFRKAAKTDYDKDVSVSHIKTVITENYDL